MIVRLKLTKHVLFYRILAAAKNSDKNAVGKLVTRALHLQWGKMQFRSICHLLKTGNAWRTKISRIGSNDGSVDTWQRCNIDKSE